VSDLRELLEALLADPSAAVDLSARGDAERLLLELAALARRDALAAPAADLVARLDSDDADVGAQVLDLISSFADAEHLEGVLAERPVTSERLAAAGEADDSAVVAPWPARYGTGDLRLTLNIEEQGRLYLSIDAAPPDRRGPVRVELAGLDPVEIGGTAGALSVVGPAAELLGGPPDFNPWVELTVHDDAGSVTLSREEPP